MRGHAALSSGSRVFGCDPNYPWPSAAPAPGLIHNHQPLQASQDGGMEQVGGQEGGANANDPPATQQNVQLLLELATRQVPSLPSSLSLSLSRAHSHAL